MSAQRKSVLKFATSLVLAIFVALAISASAQDAAQKTGKNLVKASAQSSRGGGQDSNIKSDNKANDPNAKTPPPPEKSGTRGARGCAVDVNNYTAWYVDIYVNGVFTGTVGPWGNGFVYPPAMGSALYGRANFTDGSWKYWGPQQFTCAQSSVNEWRINP